MDISGSFKCYFMGVNCMNIYFSTIRKNCKLNDTSLDIFSCFEEESNIIIFLLHTLLSNISRKTLSYDQAKSIFFIFLHRTSNILFFLYTLYKIN